MSGGRARPAPDQLADHLVMLGQAMKNPKTKISDLVRLAEKCGLQLRFSAQRTAPAKDR